MSLEETINHVLTKHISFDTLLSYAKEGYSGVDVMAQIGYKITENHKPPGGEYH